MSDFNGITIGEGEDAVRINLDNVTDVETGEDTDDNDTHIEVFLASERTRGQQAIRHLYGEQADAFLWWWDHKGTRNVLERYRAYVQEELKRKTQPSQGELERMRTFAQSAHARTSGG